MIEIKKMTFELPVSFSPSIISDCWVPDEDLPSDRVSVAAQPALQSQALVRKWAGEEPQPLLAKRFKGEGSIADLDSLDSVLERSRGPSSSSLGDFPPIGVSSEQVSSISKETELPPVLEREALSGNPQETEKLEEETLEGEPSSARGEPCPAGSTENQDWLIEKCFGFPLAMIDSAIKGNRPDKETLKKQGKIAKFDKAIFTRKAQIDPERNGAVPRSVRFLASEIPALPTEDLRNQAYAFLKAKQKAERVRYAANPEFAKYRRTLSQKYRDDHPDQMRLANERKCKKRKEEGGQASGKKKRSSDSH